MSRTYRRKNKKMKIRYFHSYNRPWYSFFGTWFDHAPTQKELKKAKSMFHSDAGTHSFREPGPSWFRNMFTERPLRRQNKLELKKFMQNPDYEPMVDSKGKLQYWT